MTGLLCSFLKKCLPNTRLKNHSLSVIILIGVLWKKWWVQLSHVLFLDNHHILIYNRSLLCVSPTLPPKILERHTFKGWYLLNNFYCFINWPASPHPPLPRPLPLPSWPFQCWKPAWDGGAFIIGARPEKDLTQWGLEDSPGVCKPHFEPHCFMLFSVVFFFLWWRGASCHYLLLSMLPVGGSPTFSCTQ